MRRDFFSKNKQTSVSQFNAEITTSRFFLYATSVILLLCVLIYSKSLNNELTQWDDDIYVVNNPGITTLGDAPLLTIKNTFTSYVNGNYHPVTMLSYCVEYYFFGHNSKVYHTTNLMLHILNSFWVLIFIWLLTKQQWVAFITALLFAIHPMHVESVAWVSERKDLLYTFFYLWALCTYLLHLAQEGNKKYYYITLLLFVISCLSKGMAVSLPVLLLLIDYFKGRSFSRNMLLEKIPFFIISIILGSVAIKAQASIGAINDLTQYNFFDRILFSCYALMMYLWKLILPLQNSCFYNYPEAVKGSYPAIIYWSPFILAIGVFLVFKFSQSLKKEVFFACCFFLITIALVLQFLPVGAAIIAERYTYIPYIGPFFLIATAFHKAIQKMPEFKRLLISLLIVVSVFLSYRSYRASLLWKDGVRLLEHAAKNEKFNICVLHYKNLAIAHFFRGNYLVAAGYYSQAIKGARYPLELICDRGVAYYKMGDYEKAILDLSTVIEQDEKHMNARHYRGLTYFNANMFKEAVNDLSVAIELNPIFADHYYFRGLSNYIMGNYTEALSDYNYMVQKNMVSSEVYNMRGLIYLKKEHYEEALADFTKSLELDKSNANAYFNKGLVYQNMLRFESALEYYEKAQQYNPAYAYTYFNKAQVLYRLHYFSSALENALKAREMGIVVDDDFMEMLKKQL